MNEDIVIPVAFFITVIVIAVGIPIARAIARAIDRKTLTPAAPPELMQRFERMEQSIDAIAVEVERISEAQRFTTKLLSERAAPERALPPREPGA
ncbi:MAG TPA: hypothetical protein VMT93_02245 [Gemmatimonadaceae bacterium]|nr:hypothetical protein [Gemmatimonadaceae bacterium]